MTPPSPRLAATRRNVTLGLLALASPATALAKPCPKPTVLFVCPAGTVKSAIAREALKRRAVERAVAVQVQSRGVHPEDHVSPLLKSRLAQDGLHPEREPARALAPGDAGRADIVIAFDEAASAPGLEHARVWDIPSWNEQYDAAQAALKPRIEALLDELAKRGCAA
jgi:protein-tyrosine-phosphatase